MDLKSMLYVDQLFVLEHGIFNLKNQVLLSLKDQLTKGCNRSRQRFIGTQQVEGGPFMFLKITIMLGRSKEVVLLE